MSLVDDEGFFYFGDVFRDIEYDEVLHETEKAILFEDSNGKFWLPKSKILTHDLANKRVRYINVVEITYIDRM